MMEIATVPLSHAETLTSLREKERERKGRVFLLYPPPSPSTRSDVLRPPSTSSPFPHSNCFTALHMRVRPLARRTSTLTGRSATSK